MSPERKTAGLTARAVVALVIHVILRGDPTGSRRTRERGRGGPRDNPKQEKSHRSANSREAARAVSERGPRIGDRASHVRGARWVQNSLRSSRATRFGDFINMRGCLSSFAAPGCWRGVVLLLVAVVDGDATVGDGGI